MKRVKTVVVKRDRVGDLWLCITALFDSCPKVVVKTGRTAGFDFGLKTYLTVSDGTRHESPLFYKRNARALKRAHRNLSRKVKGSNNRHRARIELARVYRTVANRRENDHWQLANALCKTYDTLCFETLNLDGMKRLWDGNGIGAIEIESGATVASDYFNALNRVAQVLPQISGKAVIYGGADRQSRRDGEVVPLVELRAVLEGFERRAMR